MSLLKKSVLHYSVLVLAIMLVGCSDSMKSKKKISMDSKSTTLTCHDLDKLLRVKALVNQDTSGYGEAYKKLLRNADKALEEGVFSVTTKTQTAPSGDPHDYLSLAPYWWPDSTQDDGLPWVRKDGEINPLTRGDNVDITTGRNFFSNIEKLSFAYFFSGKSIYKDHLLLLLNTWFVNPDTRMNPHLDYAQGIPGRNTGRGFGIIEFGAIVRVITALEILDIMSEGEKPDTNQVKEWLVDYLDWLQTSKMRVFEKKRDNNHGTWYDVQVTSLLLFFGEKESASEVLNKAKERIDNQFAADGRQPHEMARTKSFSYSKMNLTAFTRLAFLGKKAGVDLWSYQTPNGSGIQKGYEFLYPYATGESQWEYKQITGTDGIQESLKSLYGNAGSIFGVDDFCALANSSDEGYHSLQYPCF